MKWLRLILVIVVVISMTGCMDRLEIEDQAYVIAIGVDKGEDNLLDITLQIANPQVGTAPSASAEEPAQEHITFHNVPDIISVRDLANASVTRHITYSHMKTIIFGEELAKSEEFIRLIDSMLRDRQIRRDVNMIISRERAAVFLKNNAPKLETRPHKYYQFMSQRWEDTGLTPISTVHNYLQRMEEGASAYLAIYASTERFPKEGKGLEDDYVAGEIQSEGGNPTQVIGSAVFAHGKMIGVLSGEETKQALTLRPNPKVSYIVTTLPDPLNHQYRLTARIDIGKKKNLNINLKGEVPQIEMFVPLDVEILAIESYIDYIKSEDRLNTLETELEDIITEILQKLIQKTQKEFGAEPFKWAGTVRKQFSTIDEFEAYDWMEGYKNANVNIKVDVTLTSFGRQLNPTDIEKIKE